MSSQEGTVSSMISGTCFEAKKDEKKYKGGDGASPFLYDMDKKRN